MKLLKKFWPGCKPCLWVFVPMVVVFLILLPLSISPAGIRLGKMALPVRVSGDMITAVYGSIFGALLPLTTWISLILYGGVTKRPFVRLASFQSGILIIVLLPLSVKLRQLPSFHMLLVAIIFLFTLDGILHPCKDGIHQLSGISLLSEGCCAPEKRLPFSPRPRPHPRRRRGCRRSSAAATARCAGC